MDNDTVKTDQRLITMRSELTTAQSVGYFFVGLLGSIPCAILASLCNINAPYRSDCTKFAVIGVATRAVLSILMSALTFMM